MPIRFGFHKDSTNSIALTGSGFGLASLTYVFGFKLDTYYNRTNSHPFRPDPINPGAFGSFVYMGGYLLYRK
uniref:lectin-like domain-containing protein n=1 Tax=Enterococcus mundtii TaxID=53346 RepID=UPI0035A23FE3